MITRKGNMMAGKVEDEIYVCGQKTKMGELLKDRW